MSLLQEIYAGWKNYVFPTPAVEEEAKRRMKICVEKCPLFKPHNKFCGKCGCYMPAKVRSLKSRCPLRKW